MHGHFRCVKPQTNICYFIQRIYSVLLVLSITLNASMHTLLFLFIQNDHGYLLYGENGILILLFVMLVLQTINSCEKSNFILFISWFNVRHSQTFHYFLKAKPQLRNLKKYHCFEMNWSLVESRNCTSWTNSFLLNVSLFTQVYCATHHPLLLFSTLFFSCRTSIKICCTLTKKQLLNWYTVSVFSVSTIDCATTSLLNVLINGYNLN